MEMTIGIDHTDFGTMAEALTELWASIEHGDKVGTEFTLELEDDNAVIWQTERLLDMADRCDVPLSESSCDVFGIARGSTYKNAAQAVRHRLSDAAVAG